MTEESLNPAQDLLADLAADLDNVRTILFPGSSAELVEEMVMLHPAAEIHWLPTDSRELPAPGKTVVVHNNIVNMHIDAGSIDLVMIEATGDRGLSRRWIALTRELARPNGVLLLAGANDAGIKSAIGDAREAIGPSLVEDYRRRNRVAHIAIPPLMHEGPEWLQKPGIAPGTWSVFTVQESGIDVVFETLPGVFSTDALDAGSRLLLDHLDVPTGASVLDVGCGAGVIGVVAGRRGAASVTMTDVNLLALASAKRNSALTAATVEVTAGDVYSGVGDRRFDLIVSNPPFHQGKIVDYDTPHRRSDASSQTGRSVDDRRQRLPALRPSHARAFRSDRGRCGDAPVSGAGGDDIVKIASTLRAVAITRRQVRFPLRLHTHATFGFGQLGIPRPHVP